MNVENIKRLVKLILLFGMVCFFFPFVLVSCSGESVEASGVELMTTISLSEDIEFDEEDTPNYYLGAAFAFGVFGLICAWNASKQNKKMLASGCCSIGGVAFLLIFRSSFWEFYELTGYEGRVTVEFRWGWILSLIAYICAAGGAFIYQYMTSSSAHNSAPNEFSFRSNSVEPSEYKIHPPAAPSLHMKSEVDAIFQPVDDIPKAPDDGSDHDCQQEHPPTVIIHYTTNGQVHSFRVENYPCLIGRDGESCDVKIEDSKVSRIHAQIMLCGSEACIEDMESSNGTCVNGERISNPTEILSGDDVLVGTTHLSLEIIDTNSED